MFSILLTHFLMLLSVFGLYSPPSPLQPLPPSAAHPATIETVAKPITPSTASVVKPAAVAVEIKTKTIAPAAKSIPAPAVEVKAEETRSTLASKSATLPSTDFAADTEARILVLMNTERMSEGLSTLSADTQLAAIARAHSRDMLTHDYFDHTDLDGCSSSCRADAAGYTWSAIGENIYMTEGYELSSSKESSLVVDGWMHSSGHRANILGTKFTTAGVGIAVEGEKVYVTAVYAKPR